MKTTNTKWQIIIAHTFTYFNLLNLILAGLVFLSGQYRNMLFLGIVVANSLIGIFQELKVKKLIDALSVITATKAKKLIFHTDGTVSRIEEIPIEDIQINDRIHISIGDQIAADGTVITSNGLEVDESLLTGESLPVRKVPGDFVYSGSHVVAGNGDTQIIHVGEDNYATQLVNKAKNKRRATSEMQDAIKKIIKYVSFAIIPIGITLFCMQYFRAGETFSNSLVNTVAGVLGMIPEGLVLLTSVSFILGVGRLARKNALVQDMHSIEALARVNVLCLDKTGTITTGELRVMDIVPLDADKQTIHDIMNGLSFAFEETNETGLALQAYFKDTKPFPITDTMPFSSHRKFMGVTFEKKGTFILGAPDFICQDEAILRKAETYSSRGLRVLLLAGCKKLTHTPSTLTEVLPFGLLILADSVKEDAKETFAFFAKQGVAIKVISGDNPATVSYVAQSAGIKNAEHYIDSTTLSSDKEPLSHEIENYSVFGRVTPEMKHNIIQAYQEKGYIVGMVGDGVNDVLALKDADCGIAMANGADAAKQSAHIVLLDSDFSSMKNIVKEGRTTIANIERVSALYLTKTIYSVLLCAIFIIIGEEYPFIPIQLSLISATMIGLPSFLLTLEQHDEVTTTGFLRHVLRISLPCALTLVAALSLLQIVFVPLGFPDALVRTLNLFIGGAVSWFVIFFVCHPMTRRRFALCLLCGILFLAAFLFLPSVFNVSSILHYVISLI